MGEEAKKVIKKIIYVRPFSNRASDYSFFGEIAQKAGEPTALCSHFQSDNNPYYPPPSPKKRSKEDKEHQLTAFSKYEYQQG